jgi:PHD/YefM family antitoxin component YafN of YafNO toxin-antitoxin module
MSELCHTKKEPIFITKNGYGDLVVMNIEIFKALYGRYELYHRLYEGLADDAAGKHTSFDDFMNEFRGEIT